MSERFWVNFTGFQIVWWLCVLYRDDSVFIVSLLLMLHLVFHSQPIKEALVVVVLAFVGFAIDLLLTVSGFFIFANASLPPFWLFLLWMGFSATLRQSLAYFNDKVAVAAIFGAAGGSSSYIAAAELGAVDLGFSMIISLIALGLIWLVLFPLLLKASLWIGSQNVKRV